MLRFDLVCVYCVMNVGTILGLAGADGRRCRGRHLAASDVPAATGHIPPASTLLAERVSAARVLVVDIRLCNVTCADVYVSSSIEQIHGFMTYYRHRCGAGFVRAVEDLRELRCLHIDHFRCLFFLHPFQHLSFLGTKA